MEQEQSSKSLGEVSSPTESKKDVTSPRRGPKTRNIKRRPKTAASTVKRTDSHSDTASTQSSPTKPRRNSLATHVVKKTERRSQLVSTPVTKQAFRVPAAPNKNIDTTKQQETEDSGFSGSRKMSVVSNESSKSNQSCKSSRSEEHSRVNGVANRTNGTVNRTNSDTIRQNGDKTRQKDDTARQNGDTTRQNGATQQTGDPLAEPQKTAAKAQDTNKTTNLSARTYSHGNKKDGKANWRQTSLIKTKYCLNSGVLSQQRSSVAPNNCQTTEQRHGVHTNGPLYRHANSTSPVSENILSLANSKNVPTVTNGCLYGNKTARIQWPPIKDSSVKSEGQYRGRVGEDRVYMSSTPRSSVTISRTSSLGQHTSSTRASVSYKWKNEGSHRTNKANVMVRRSLPLSESIFRPQANYRTYSYR